MIDKPDAPEPEPEPERKEPTPKAPTPVQYNVVDQPWSPSDPAATQAMLTQQGQAGWQLSTVWPDPQRERTRWIFSTPSGAAGAAPTFNDVGRNLIHNPLFNIQQRGAGPWTASAYTADRWSMNIAAPDTATFAIYGASDGMRSQAGDEAMRFFLQCNFTGTATGQIQLNQNIEDVRRLANKTVTLSFYAQAGVAGTKLEFVFAQSFGTGGSASAAVYISAPSVTLTAVMARYSLTLALPSIAGKTLGTNGDDFTQMIFLFNQGAGGFIQSGIVNLWGVQLEIGSVATPLEKPDPQQDLAKCQRFYQTIVASGRGSAYQINSIFDCTVTFQPMRAQPTATLVAAGGSANLGAGNPTLYISTNNSARFEIGSAAAGDTYAITYLYGLSADL